MKVQFNPVSLKCFTGILLKFTELPSFDDSSITLWALNVDLFVAFSGFFFQL